MKKTMKILTVLLIAILMITFATNVLAADVSFDQLTPNYQGDSSSLVTKATNIIMKYGNYSI